MGSSRLATGWLPGSATVRRWLNRAFILSILAYLVVVGYLVAEAVMGASRWAPYGVNVPLFIGLVVASEVVIAVTAAIIFREDAGIWPPAIAEGWATFRRGSRLRGLRQVAAGAWDIPIMDLRLRTTRAIALGRANRIAALVPLLYALIASAGGAPWGLRGSALFDVVITMAVWAFMEIVMVRPEAAPAAATKRSYYQIRRVRPSDTARILEMERSRWKAQAATPEQVRSRLETYPQGQIASVHTVEVDGRPVREKVAAWITLTCVTEHTIGDVRSWETLTSHGTIASCDPEGDTIVGVNLTSVTEGGIYLLIGETLASVVEWNKEKMLGVSRLTGFVALNARRAAEGKRALTAIEYALLREVRGYHLNEARLDSGGGPLTDEEYFEALRKIYTDRGTPPPAEDERPDYVCSNLREYLGIPGATFVRVIPDYFEDRASDDYGVQIEWRNPVPRPLRYLPFVRRLVANAVRRETRKAWEDHKARVRKAAQRRKAARVPEFLREGELVAVAEEQLSAARQAPRERERRI